MKQDSKEFLMLYITSETVDNKLVIAGSFEMVNSRGVPLEVILQFCKDHGLIIDWVDFIYHGIKMGWKLKTLSVRIKSSIGEVFGPHYLKRFEVTFDQAIDLIEY